MFIVLFDIFSFISTLHPIMWKQIHQQKED